ncbi:hypothetical protein Malapachy_1859 [Malassezia pachydermatis]|uniref:Uncharacterized protein n=1 Tax=Malassezia pachydermatis TaxID=77020 RepID=A0A0M9VP44_9BASI|nr:hypothetical protein Malapachy_1859 [Malassezia pachydermatis]KOS13855.1 hypothetical protein Malapachy_1859 [Malassezia pachydermatis]
MPHKSAALRQNNALSRYAEKLMTRLEAAQLHARLQSMWLDQYNQRFWTDNNVRFSRALQEYESTISPNTPASLEQVSPFYREWLATNAERLRHYNRTLWVATYKVIGAQVWYRCVLGYTRVVAWLAGMRE